MDPDDVRRRGVLMIVPRVGLLLLLLVVTCSLIPLYYR